MGEFRDRKMKLETAPATIKERISKWFATGISAEEMVRRLDDYGYHTNPATVRKFLTKKNVELSRLAFGSEALQSEVAKEYSTVVSSFAKTSQDLSEEFDLIKERKTQFKNELDRIRAMVEIGRLMKENVEFANKLLSVKVTATVDSTDVLGTIAQLSGDEFDINTLESNRTDSLPPAKKKGQRRGRKRKEPKEESESEEDDEDDDVLDLLNPTRRGSDSDDDDIAVSDITDSTGGRDDSV